MLTDNATITVKRGDTHDITFTIFDVYTGLPSDLTGATAKVYAALTNGGPTIVLDAVIAEPATNGRVVHKLTGTLAIGCYDYEVELNRNGTTATSPTDGFGTLIVRPDIPA